MGGGRGGGAGGGGGGGGGPVPVTQHCAVTADSEADPHFGEPAGEDVSQVQRVQVTQSGEMLNSFILTLGLHATHPQAGMSLDTHCTAHAPC